MSGKEQKPDRKDQKSTKDRAGREYARALGLFTQLGFSMAGCVFLGVMGGRFLDSRLGTSPWLLLIGSLLGGVASFKVLYDIAVKGWSDE